MSDGFRWFPFLGWKVLSEEEVEQLELDPYFRWKALTFEWLHFGLVLVGKPAGISHP